jgi:Tfp pilus assembly protein PilF
MGAVYEGKGDMDSAIAEYVKVLNEPGEGRDTVAKRLAQLSRRAGLPEKIAAAYNNARSRNPGDWQLVIGYAVYQAEREQQAEALALLRSEVERSTDVAFLETTRDLFREILRPEDERQVLARLAAVARDEREAMMYRLQQAAFLERNNQVDAAVQIIDKLVADHPTNLGVVEESAQFYWRAGLLDRSIELYKQTLAQARGANRRGLVLQLARRQFDAGKLADAEATLRGYYDENRLDSEVFGELARTLGAENKLAELAELYSAAFKDVRESGLGGVESRARVAELRAGMIRTLDSLGRYQDAIDQHIEIINAFPEEADRLAAAIDYAERHDLVERLVGYYEKLTKESFKNYRWQLVLGRIYERRGNLAGASEQYLAAAVNEPQRPDLRFALASALARQRRYDEAITVLREGWALAGRDPQWLIEAARIQVQQGKRDDAVQTIRQALAAKKNAKAQDLLEVASQLVEWGLDAEAVRIYEQTFAELPRTLKDEYLPFDAISRYVRALVRVEPVAQVFQKIERQRSRYRAIAQNSQDTDGYKARGIVSQIDAAMRSDFGRGVIDYASAQETSALSAAVQAATRNLTLYSDREEMARYLGIARGAGLVETEERIYVQIKDAAFKERTRPEDLRPYNELRALVAFYNRHAAFTRAAEALSTEYARDPFKGQFDYQYQIAAEYRLAGDSSRELEWLRAAYQSASGNLASGQVEWVDRYLSVLYSSGRRDDLQRLASTYSPHQLQLINFFIEKGERELARTAIANARQSQAWIASRSGEVGLFLKDTSVETEAFFKSALDVRSIGEMLGRRPDDARVLLGDDWFVAARNYGFWLGLATARESDSRDFVVAEAERHPSSAKAQLELVAYYLDRKDAIRATNSLAIAAELAPGAKEIAVFRGSIALSRGDRRGALDAWNTLISGRATVSDAAAYLKVTADNGMLREALPQIENYIVAFLNRSTRNDREERLEAIKPVVREMAARAASDAALVADVAATLLNTVSRMPDDLVIARMIIDESLLPDAQMAGLYRITHQRLSDLAAALFGTSEYESGYYNGSEYIYPARALANFRRSLLDYLIRGRSFDEARLLIATIKQEQAELELALEDSDSQAATDRYYWLPLASALVELRGGGDAAKAVAELRRYCGLDAGPSDAHRLEESGAVDERCLKAYALLIAERREADADSMLYDAYRAAARSRFSNDASLAGLAEIEARRGRMDEAARLLRQMVERSTDNQRALRLAAEVAARIGRYDEAIAFREQIAQANPTDATNRLELARAVAAAGRAGEAIDRIVALIAERATPNSVRAQAAEAVGIVVRADRSQAGRVASLLDRRISTGDSGAALVKASALEAAGSIEEARSLLQSITGGSLSAVAQMKLGLIARSAGRDAEAVNNFERALYLDADGAITGPIAFRAPGPRVQLILLYGRTGRDLAAIRLAEGETATQQSAISSVVLTALASGSERVEAPAQVSFEPSLETTRTRLDGLRTLAELNDLAGTGTERELLASLAQSASRLGQYDRAIAMERVLVAEAARPEEKAAFEKALAEMVAARQARQTSAARLFRIDASNTSESIYAFRSQI